MAFTVQEFRSQLRYDGARPNLFRVAMSFPSLSLSGSNGANEKLTFMCRAAQLPGSTVNQIPINYYGREVKVWGNRTFQEWTLTIINDEDFLVRNAFEQWLSGGNSHAGNLRDPAFIQGDGGYQTDAKIYQEGKTGNVIKTYNMIGCFPIDLSPIEVDWGANDAVEEFSVTLGYQWFESNTTDFTTNVSMINP